MDLETDLGSRLLPPLLPRSSRVMSRPSKESVVRSNKVLSRGAGSLQAEGKRDNVKRTRKDRQCVKQARLKDQRDLNCSGSRQARGKRTIVRDNTERVYEQKEQDG